jgi:hypothetical protein
MAMAMISDADAAMPLANLRSVSESSGYRVTRARAAAPRLDRYSRRPAMSQSLSARHVFRDP